MSALIVLEGCDAAGKATHSKLLAERISRTGNEAVLYSFHRYDTVVGRAIKRHLLGDTMVAEQSTIGGLPVQGGHSRAPEDPLVFQCMALADKMEAAADIRAHLRAGRFVICDRWTPSCNAYGAADGLDRDWLKRVQEPLPEADLYLYLQVSEAEALRRRPVLRDRYEKDRAKQDVVRGEYERLWEANAFPGSNRGWMTIDGEGPDVATVHERIWAAVVAAARGVL